MIYIDPSELRKNSNTLKHISDVVYKELPDLEARTGADLMVSPDDLPHPFTDKLLKLHIESGAKLIQVKFGHDLPASIVDGRLNEALSRMLKAGAMTWQCILLIIGIFSYDGTKGMALINGQLTHGHPLKWKNIQSALNFWVERGGALDYPLATGKLLALHLSIHQDHLNRFRDGEDTKYIWPKAPVFYNEIMPKSKHLRKWKVLQRLELVDDLRPLLCSIPSAKIGPSRANAIFEYMKRRSIRQDLTGFLYLVQSGEIEKVPGIGSKIRDQIQSGLFKTRRERDGSKKRETEKKVQE